MKKLKETVLKSVQIEIDIMHREFDRIGYGPKENEDPDVAEEREKCNEDLIALYDLFSSIERAETKKDLKDLIEEFKCNHWDLEIAD